MNAIKSEDQFRRHVIDVALGEDYHVTHIESHLTSAGVPDLNLAKILDCWVELKIVKYKGAPGHITMRPTQKKWHTQRHNKGGTSWVMVFDPDAGVVMVLAGEEASRLGSELAKWQEKSRFFKLADLASALEFMYEER